MLVSPAAGPLADSTERLKKVVGDGVPIHGTVVDRSPEDTTACQPSCVAQAEPE